MIDYTGLTRAFVFAALYNAAAPAGRGFEHYDPTPMTEVQAGDYIFEREHFDYIDGRCMKLYLPSDTLIFDPRDYDAAQSRDRGGVVSYAERVLQTAKLLNDVNAPSIAASHRALTYFAARSAHKSILLNRHTKVGPGIHRLTLPESLLPKLEAILDDYASEAKQ